MRHKEQDKVEGRQKTEYSHSEAVIEKAEEEHGQYIQDIQGPASHYSPLITGHQVQSDQLVLLTVTEAGKLCNTLVVFMVNVL